jgi:hypothetical protein
MTDRVSEGDLKKSRIIGTPERENILMSKLKL